jgi:tripartite-type tricarboxylate transporter receptor subunit TctC
MNIVRREFLGLLGGLASLPVASRAAMAQRAPVRNVDIIVPFEPGGSADAFARLLGAYITRHWGVPTTVLNKPGAKGIPQTLELYAARPDGQTVIVDNPSTNTVLAAVNGAALPFDVMDRTYLGNVLGTYFMMLVPADSPYKTIQQLLDDARADPQKLSYTSQGSAGMPDYFIRSLCMAAGVDIAKASPVMVTGSGSVMTMTAGGHVGVGLASESAAASSIKGGLVRALVISSGERSRNFPDVPTTVELGYPSVVSWNGISGPPKMPQDIVQAWQSLLKDATGDAEFLAGLGKMSASPLYMDSQQMRAHVGQEIDTLKKLFGKA